MKRENLLELKDFFSRTINYSCRSILFKHKKKFWKKNTRNKIKFKNIISFNKKISFLLQIISDMFPRTAFK